MLYSFTRKIAHRAFIIFFSRYLYLAIKHHITYTYLNVHFMLLLFHFMRRVSLSLVCSKVSLAEF